MRSPALTTIDGLVAEAQQRLHEAGPGSIEGHLVKEWVLVTLHRAYGRIAAAEAAAEPFTCAGCGHYIAGEYWHEGCGSAVNVTNVASSSGV